MSWFKIDADAVEDPRIRRVGERSDAAFSLWCRSTLMSHDSETPGHITEENVRALGGDEDSINVLLEEGVWSRSGDGYDIVASPYPGVEEPVGR